MLDRFAKMLEDAGHYRAAGDVCQRCRTAWPCETATQTMGPDLTGFGPDAGDDGDHS